MVARLQEHQRQGHAIALLSASVPHIVEPLARHLGVAHALCTPLEVDARGRFTGRAQGPVCIGATKREHAIGLATRLGLDLASSYAYTYHHFDRPLLEAVGHPVAVTPNRALACLARVRSWEALK